MNKIISVFALSAFFNVAHAAGFAPWSVDASGPSPITVQTSSLAPASGFAPWRDGPRVMDAPDAMQMGTTDGSGVFSPWS